MRSYVRYLKKKQHRDYSCADPVKFSEGGWSEWLFCLPGRDVVNVRGLAPLSNFASWIFRRGGSDPTPSPHLLDVRSFDNPRWWLVLVFIFKSQLQHDLMFELPQTIYFTKYCSGVFKTFSLSFNYIPCCISSLISSFHKISIF